MRVTYYSEHQSAGRLTSQGGKVRLLHLSSTRLYLEYAWLTGGVIVRRGDAKTTARQPYATPSYITAATVVVNRGAP